MVGAVSVVTAEWWKANAASGEREGIRGDGGGAGRGHVNGKPNEWGDGRGEESKGVERRGELYCMYEES